MNIFLPRKRWRERQSAPRLRQTPARRGSVAARSAGLRSRGAVCPAKKSARAGLSVRLASYIIPRRGPQRGAGQFADGARGTFSTFLRSARRAARWFRGGTARAGRLPLPSTGCFSPLTVRRARNGYAIVAGERRLRAPAPAWAGRAPPACWWRRTTSRAA